MAIPYREKLLLRVPQIGLLLLSVALAGCGPGKGKVSGRVVFNGKPLPAGKVMFMPADGQSSVITVDLDESGNFPQVELPVGEVMVSVDNREFAPPAPVTGPIELPSGIAPGALAPAQDSGPRANSPAAAARNARYVPIPSRYYTAEESRLRITVRPGEQTEEIALSN